MPYNAFLWRSKSLLCVASIRLMPCTWPVSKPLQSPRRVGMLLACLAKLNAFHTVDLDPLHFVHFTSLGPVFRLLVGSIIGRVCRETVRHRRDADDQRGRVSSARRAPRKRRRPNLLLGPTRRHGPGHALPLPLDLLTAGERRDLFSRRPAGFG